MTVNDRSSESNPLGQPISRRQLLKIAGTGTIGAVGLCVVGAANLDTQVAEGSVATAQRQVYGPNATGLVIAHPDRCVACGRCELACTEFNDGKSQPSIARIKMNRNYHWGPEGVQFGWWDGKGRFGNHVVVQDTCKQCPHPVPCQMACPYGAIEISGPANARVINPDKCQGCRTCQMACPWEMTSFDEDLGIATKCHLCEGDPKCVKACPAGALEFVPWVDMTKTIPERFVVPAYISSPADVDETCSVCH